MFGERHGLFGRCPSPYVSTEKDLSGSDCCTCSHKVDVRDIMDTMVRILTHPDYRVYREEFLEALGLLKEEGARDGEDRA